ncbi:MAG: sulfotransferase family 2 domain-containing protein [Woeseia sp.]
MPRTATHTIRQALASHLGPDDWEQQDLFEKRRLPHPEIAQIEHGHISARQIRDHLSDEVWNSYHRFAFVRNPFDRFVSTCFFLNRKNSGFEDSAIPFMKQALTVDRFRRRILVVPQSALLTDEDGSLVLDSLGRYERLQESYDEICDRIGIQTTELGRKNPSKHDRFSEYYDDELKEMVADFYKDDLRLFSYRFDSSSPMN